MRRTPLLLLFALAGCHRPAGGGAACGMAAVFGPLALLGEFTTPGRTLVSPPATLPERLPARLVAGPVYPALVGRDHDRWVLGVNGARPPRFSPGFAVLVEDTTQRPLGAVIYEGEIVRGAPLIGTVALADTTIPLIGVMAPRDKIEDPSCPLFPDSTLR